MKKILIADDHSAIRTGVKQMLLDEFNEIEFGEAVNAAEVFKKINGIFLFLTWICLAKMGLMC